MARRGEERLAGVYVGDMRVLARCEDRELSSGRFVEQWLCRCTCGALQKRVRSHIVRAIRHGQNMSCYACRDGLRRGLRELRLEARREVFAQWWQDYGSLYPPLSVGLPDERDDVSTTVAEGGPDHSGDTHSRINALYPINLGPRRVLACCECGAFVSDCFGCVDCMEAVCVECVRKGKHRHTDRDGDTLSEIGQVFNVSRERIRGIEVEALGKLARRMSLLTKGRRIHSALTAGEVVKAHDLAATVATTRAQRDLMWLFLIRALPAFKHAALSGEKDLLVPYSTWMRWGGDHMRIAARIFRMASEHRGHSGEVFTTWECSFDFDEVGSTFPLFLHDPDDNHCLRTAREILKLYNRKGNRRR